MNTVSEQISLTEALSEARIPELPELLKEGGKPWAQAIVKVQKVNTKINWALARNNGFGEPVIYKDFGSPAMIAKILEIRPYTFLQPGNIPDLRNKSDIIKYLCSFGESEDKVKKMLSTKKDNDEEKTEEEKNGDRSWIKKIVTYYAIKEKIAAADERFISRRKIDGYE